MITGPLCLALVGRILLLLSRARQRPAADMDEGGFILDYWMPAGSSLEETNRVLSAVEVMLRDTPEVESTSRRTGMQLGLAAVTEANTGDFAVKLKRKRSRGVDEIETELREKIATQFPMLQVEFVQLLQDMIGDLTSAPEPIEIKLFSQDQALLREWAPKVADAIKKIDGVVDVLNGIDNTISGPATRVPGRSHGCDAGGIHPGRGGTRCQRDHAGRTGSHSRRRQRTAPIRYASGSPNRPIFAGSDAQHRSGKFYRAEGDAQKELSLTVLT